MMLCVVDAETSGAEPASAAFEIPKSRIFTLFHFGILERLRLEELERDPLAELCVVRRDDEPHPGFAEHPLDGAREILTFGDRPRGRLSQRLPSLRLGHRGPRL